MASHQAVNIHEAKTRLSELLVQVQRGHDVVIAKAGRPIARLTAYTPPKRRIAPPGSLGDMDFWMADDFNDPIDELFDCLKE